MKAIRYISVLRQCGTKAQVIWECAPVSEVINKIPTPSARTLAMLVSKDGKPRTKGRWTVRAYSRPNPNHIDFSTATLYQYEETP